MLRFSLLFALSLALAACAGAPSSSDGVPGDFLLEVRSRGAANPHCDFTVEIDARGEVAYEVSLRGPSPSDRSGAARLDRERLATLWRAVEAADLAAHPAHVGPAIGGEERGLLTIRLHAHRRDVQVVADRAGTPQIDFLLRTLYWALPTRIFRPVDGH